MTIISQMHDFSDSSIVNPSADEDDMDNHLAAIYKPTIDMIWTITWDMVKQETPNNASLTKLITWILNDFPTNCHNLEPKLQQCWGHREHLLVINDVIMLNNQVVIPPAPRP